MKEFLAKLLGIKPTAPKIPTPDYSRDVFEFMRLHPNAPLEKWQEFVVTACERAFEHGFITGSLERMAKEDALTPEEHADLVDPDWRNSPPVDLRNGGKGIGELAVDQVILGDSREEFNK